MYSKASSNPKVHMGTICGGEARELYASNPIVLMPLGSHEDQGPHVPMGDYLLAEALAERAAIKANEQGLRTVVAPVLPFGGADWFGPMPGGLAISQNTLTIVLRELLASLHRHNLTRVIIINGHGGNIGPITEVAKDLYREHKILLPSVNIWKVARGMLPAVVGAEVAKKSGGHGADPLTSVAMHLLPDAMRPDLTPAAQPLKSDPVLGLKFRTMGIADFDGHEIDLPNEYADVFCDGVGAGDPSYSNEATGAALAEKVATMITDFSLLFASKVPQ